MLGASTGVQSKQSRIVLYLIIVSAPGPSDGANLRPNDQVEMIITNGGGNAVIKIIRNDKPLRR
jgi:hypothetical protein